MKTTHLILAGSILFGAATTASAATFTASSAVGSGADHSLWISTGMGSGLGKDFDFAPDGIFTTTKDGMGGKNAVLSGSVTSDDGNGAGGFDLNFFYDSVWTDGFNPTFKSENGSAYDSNDDADGVGYYLDLAYGILEGTGILDGLLIKVERKPPFDADETVAGNGGTPDYATQIGGSVDGIKNGANNKNTNFGMANWFMVSEVSCDGTKACAQNGVMYSGLLLGKQGDINIDLTPVPLPAGGLLILSALAGFGAMRKRTKAA